VQSGAGAAGEDDAFHESQILPSRSRR
jgi:hypothetical protein